MKISPGNRQTVENAPYVPAPSAATGGSLPE
jgi:hypothetical protein